MKNNYPTKKLEDVCNFQNGFAFKSSHYSDSGYFVMRITNVQDGYIELNNPKYIKVDESNNFILNKGDILMSLTGNVGRVGVVQESHLPAVLNQRVARINILYQEVLDKKYLFYFLQSPTFFSKVVSGGKGMAQQNVSTKHIKNLEIPLPPLEEQKKIVKVLEEKLGKIDEMIKLRKENIEDTEKLLSARLHEIFEEGKKNDWDEVGLGKSSILKMTSGGTPKRSNNDYYGGNIPWLKSGELNDNRSILDSEEKITNKAIEESSAKIFPAGTVLFAMYGATAGKLGILNTEAATNQAVAGLTPTDKLNISFLFYFLMKKRQDILKEAWGGAQPNLSQTILKKFKIPLPDLEIQEKIVKELDDLSGKIDQIKTLQKSQLENFKDLKQAYLREAFKGKLI